MRIEIHFIPVAFEGGGVFATLSKPNHIVPLPSGTFRFFQLPVS